MSTRTQMHCTTDTVANTAYFPPGNDHDGFVTLEISSLDDQEMLVLYLADPAQVHRIIDAAEHALMHFEVLDAARAAACTCTLIRAQTPEQPAEWEQHPDCPVHPAEATAAEAF